jgi:hypothetical protein
MDAKSHCQVALPWRDPFARRTRQKRSAPRVQRRAGNWLRLHSSGKAPKPLPGAQPRGRLIRSLAKNGRGEAHREQAVSRRDLWRDGAERVASEWLDAHRSNRLPVACWIVGDLKPAHGARRSRSERPPARRLPHGSRSQQLDGVNRKDDVRRRPDNTHDHGSRCSTASLCAADEARIAKRKPSNVRDQSNSLYKHHPGEHNGWRVQEKGHP